VSEEDILLAAAHTATHALPEAPAVPAAHPAEQAIHEVMKKTYDIEEDKRQRARSPANI
jgi:hypothetical protein